MFFLSTKAQRTFTYNKLFKSELKLNLGTTISARETWKLTSEKGEKTIGKILLGASYALRL